jgi:hypothetical protein
MLCGLKSEIDLPIFLSRVEGIKLMAAQPSIKTLLIPTSSTLAHMYKGLRPHNMVLSDFERKTTKSLSVILLSVIFETIIRPTLFVVVSSKANYNMLLGREWIHGVGAVPSTLHQVLSISQRRLQRESSKRVK